MLTTSSFTFEFTANPVTKKPEWNLPSNEIPPTLAIRGVKLGEWKSFFRYASGVAERAIQREEINKSLDARQGPAASWGGLTTGGGNNKNNNNNKAAKEALEAQKAENDRETVKGWKQVEGRLAMMYKMGITVTLLRDSRRNAVYGLEFQSDDPSKHRKVNLRYDYRREAWNCDRDTVPTQLADKMTSKEWSMLYDRGQSIIQRQQVRLKEQVVNRNKAVSNIPVIGGGTANFSGTIQQYVVQVTKGLQEEAMSKKLDEMEWLRLESLAKDILPLNDVDVSLLVNDGMTLEAPFLYSGLEFRLLKEITNTTATTKNRVIDRRT